MGNFQRRIRPHVDAELTAAFKATESGRADLAFAHLERAHVLGQASTIEHVRVHWLMLLWALKERNGREVSGQLLRLIGASTKTALGLVPHGNTGGSNVSPLERMPIEPELEALIKAAHGSPD